jgi:hypothetical protein
MKRTLLSTLAVLTSAQKTVREACTSNTQCQATLGEGACCLYFESENRASYDCRSKVFTNFYVNAASYD